MARSTGRVKAQSSLKFKREFEERSQTNAGKAAGDLVVTRKPFPASAAVQEECGFFDIGCRADKAVDAVQSFFIKAAFIGITGFLAFKFLESFLKAKGSKAGGK